MPDDRTKPARLERNLGWIALLLLLIGCLLVLRPFASALLWAVVLCVSSWPLYQRLLKLLRGRRTLAALVMALGMILVMLLPFLSWAQRSRTTSRNSPSSAQTWIDAGPPAPPAWLAKVPVVGQQATERWQALATDSAKLLEATKRFIEPVASWLLIASVAIGRGLFQLALSIFIAFFLFRDGLAIGERLTAGVQRIGGERGMHLLEVAGNTVRGVVYGILGTGLVQALMAGIGFFIAGVPGAALLALLTFFLSVVPVGPPLVWIPAGALALLSRFDGLGNFHARVGSAGQQRGQRC